MEMSEWSAFLNDCAAWGLFPEEALLNRLEIYYQFLVKRNEQMNLTAVTEKDRVLQLHFLDSLALIKNHPPYEEREGQRLLDIGSGAGFPGMVLKLFRPGWQVTLLDAQRKRVDFLRETAERLFEQEREECGTAVVHARAEELAHEPAYRASFDLCTVRAVSKLRVLAEYALSFLKTGGVFAAYKSQDTDMEIMEAEHALKILGGKILSVDDYILPNSDIARRLVYIEKTEETHARYPRRAGIPEKKPL